MTPTVPFPVSPRPVAEKDVATWINGEALKLLEQLRAAANFLRYERPEPLNSAGDGAWETLWTSPEMATNCVWQIEANLVGVTVSGAAQRYSYRRISTFHSSAGTVALIGNAAPVTQETTVAGDVQFVINAGRTISIQARDNAVSPTRWTLVVSINEGLTA